MNWIQRNNTLFIALIVVLGFVVLSQYNSLTYERGKRDMVDSLRTYLRQEREISLDSSIIIDSTPTNRIDKDTITFHNQAK